MIEFEPTSTDAAVAWHRGDPFTEARALVAGDALVDLSHYGVIRVSGADRREWLHLLVTQAVDQIAPGQSCHALILSAQGHIEYDLKVVAASDCLWLITEPETADALTVYLESMVFMYDVAVEDVSQTYAVFGGFTGAVASESVAAWTAPAAFSVPQPGQDPYVPARPAPWPATLSIVPRSAQVDAGAGMWAWESLRIAAAVPRLGLDIDHRSLPHEVGLIGSAVHLHKGCYRGQEAVARTINLGRPPRRLVLLHLDGAEDQLPAAGTDVRLQDSDIVVGRVGSAVQHYEQGPLALAVVKRSAASDVDFEIAAASRAIRAGQVPVVVID